MDRTVSGVNWLTAFNGAGNTPQISEWCYPLIAREKIAEIPVDVVDSACNAVVELFLSRVE